jgi:hypothetical protein
MQPLAHKLAKYVGNSGPFSRRFASSSHGGSPYVQQQPLEETNSCPSREREVSLKIRRLNGGIVRKCVHGLTLAVAHWHFRKSGGGVAEAKALEAARSLAHWGVQVGPYLWEAQADRGDEKTLSMQRLTGSQIWKADLGVDIVGKTRLSDHEIQRAGDKKEPNSV